MPRSSPFRASIWARSTAAHSTIRDLRSKSATASNSCARGKGRYDLIVLDLTDPGGPSEALYTPDFYRACAPRLEEGGAMTLHIASPVAHPERIRATMTALRQAFPLVTPYLTSIPLYGGLWMMACASATLDPATLTAADADRRIAARRLTDLRYYNGDMHRAALALPNFVRELVAG